MKPTISPVGDCAISIDFGQVIDPKINRHIRQTIERIQALQLDGIIELVPTYCALLVLCSIPMQICVMSLSLYFLNL